MRLLGVVVGALVLIAAGAVSATLLDFEPGAWLAYGVLMALAVGKLLGIVPGPWIDGD